jgi:4-amino-4-deoxy-L-arabinose transferase-like glycosyltransferase
VDLAVFPLVAILSVPPLLWFGHHPWTVIGYDAPRYLFAGSELISGGGLDSLAGISNFNGGHGPVFPALIGFLILTLGRDTESLVWAVRLIALLNPLLTYFLTKRLSGPLAGLLAAALVTLFGFDVKSTFMLNIDAILLTFYLLALLALFAAIKGDTSPTLALLSGLLLGLSVLTKETALANLPLALLAVLLLDWELRKALWHYLGTALVCMPWWIWRWSATGEVYLIDRLPPSLQLPISVASAILLSLALRAHTFGIVDRFLAEEHRRRWVGRFVAVTWTILLSILLLTTAAPALPEVSFESLRLYLAELLAPTLVVVPLLLIVVGYVAWRQVQRGGSWTLLALAILFQIPVCLLVVVVQWNPRQYLVLQALVFCALATLVVDASEAASRGRGYAARLAGAMVAVPLVIMLLVASVGRVQALLPDSPVGGLSGRHLVSPQATEMVDWMTENVPEGVHILVNVAQGNYLAYLDGGRHEWMFLRLDQDICESRPNLQTNCDPDENAVSRIPPDAVWVQMKDECRVISLSMTYLLQQVPRTGSGYVMITGNAKYPSILELSSLLRKSGAFQVVHAEGRSSSQGVVLLKSTGREPEAMPTLINKHTVIDLKRCEQAKGREYSNWLRSKFPNGIREATVSD